MLYHGLSAYNKALDSREVIRRLYLAEKSEVCLSNVKIGDIGLGVCESRLKDLRGYSCDCFSYISEGERNTNHDYIAHDYDVCGVDYLGLDILEYESNKKYVAKVVDCVNTRSSQFSKTYAEFHCEPSSFDFIWYNPECRKSYLTAKKLSLKTGLPILSC